VKILDKLYRYLPYLLILSALGIDLGLYFAHYFQKDLFNADLLYLPALYRDVVVNSGSFFDWFLTPAPYYFPDMPLYFLSNLLTGNYYYAIPLFMTLQSLLLLLVLYRIYRLFFEQELSLTLTALLFAFLHLYPSIVTHFMHASGIHYGEFLSGLYLLYMVLWTLKEKTLHPLVLFLLFALVLLTTASDSLFLLHFILPLSLSLMILWATRYTDIKTLLSLLFLFALAVKLGKKLNHLIAVNGSLWYKVNIDTSLQSDHGLLSGNNIHALKEIFATAYTQHTSTFVLGMLVLAAALASLLLKKRLATLYERYDSTKLLIFLSLFLLLMSAGSLYVLSLSRVPAVPRYMIPFFELPILLLPIYLGFLGLFKDHYKNRLLLGILSLLLLAGLVLHAKHKLKDIRFKTDYYPPITQCIDRFVRETGAKNGISTYWNAKPIYMSSKEGVTLAQVKGDLKPVQHICSNRWFMDRYDFILNAHDMDHTLIERINGKADKIYHCPNADILYYAHKLRITQPEKAEK